MHLNGNVQQHALNWAGNGAGRPNQSEPYRAVYPANANAPNQVQAVCPANASELNHVIPTEKLIGAKYSKSRISSALFLANSQQFEGQLHPS